jgi:hypothetical protein
MKKSFLTCAVLLMGIFLAGNGLCATYNATGTWKGSLYRQSNNCVPESPFDPPYITTTVNQYSDSNVVVDAFGHRYTGSVTGATYEVSAQWSEEGGIVRDNLTFTLTSNTSATGSGNWIWTHPDHPDDPEWVCSGSHRLIVYKQDIPVKYDASGTWDYTESGHVRTCENPDDTPRSGAAYVNQTGSSVNLTVEGHNYTGTASGVAYTASATYSKGGGIIKESITLTLNSSTSGSGKVCWTYTEPDYQCRGSQNISFTREQQTFTISGTVSQLQGVLMTLSGDAGGTTTTNSSGNCSFGNLTNGNYTVTPTMEGYRFQPASRNVTINNGDKTGIDFVAHQMARAMPWLSLLLDEDGATVVSAYQEGDFWEYRWDAKKTISDRDGTRTTRDSGSFAVVLGSPRQIKGITTNEVLVTGDSIPDKVSTSWDFAPRWRYIAKVGKKILGSEDGITLKTIFDGQTGQWYGGGFFVSFAEDKLITAVPGEIDNDYLKSSALTVGDETSQSHCEWVAGKWICPNEDSYNRRTNEYYIENVDPVGLYHNNYAYFGGTFPQAFRWIYNVGLVSSSFWGAPRRSIISEVEPNNYQSDAQAVDIPSFASGDVSVGSGYKMGISCDYPPTNVEDWYKFTLSQNANVTIRLTFGVQADLDLFLMNDTPGSHGYKIESPFGTLCSSYHDGYSLLAMSIDDNVALGTLTEEIVVTLDAGNYFVGVDAFANPNNGAIDYILEFNAQ